MSPRLPRGQAEQRGLRLWPVGRALTLAFTTAILVAGTVFYSAWHLLGARELKPEHRIDSKTLFDLVKLSFGVVAGAGALVALVVAYRRQRVDEDGAQRDATRLHTERFTTAVSQLGDDSPAIRLGGVHALAGLADDAPTRELRQTCIDVLCAYLQLPFTPDPGDDPEHQEEHNRYLALRKVRHTILRLIGDHYQRPMGNPGSWQGCHLDLTGVTIDGDLDLGSACFTGARVSFDSAIFSGGTVSFDSAIFSGGTVSFDSAIFSGGTVSFDSAAFSGGEVSFCKAAFSGGEVWFHSAAFSGGEVSFIGAAFSGGTVSFHRAAFSGGEVSFYSAAFSGGDVSFGNAAFSGGKVLFSAAFSGGDVSFHNAAFSGGEVWFGGAAFSGGEVSFHSATFSGDRVWFNRSAFSGGDVSFHSAAFSAGTVTFRHATLSGGTVTFRQATGTPPSGLVPADGSPLPTGLLLPEAWYPTGQ
ncbi:pentapeptide repeat-containing protein [Streptomyces paradoxus]|uniref:pentapeptide repeat-containing protein n=1 Tax=Streptomyces paradoxus TaxID=66375 RepID=UPI00363BE9C2